MAACMDECAGAMSMIMETCLYIIIMINTGIIKHIVILTLWLVSVYFMSEQTL